MDQFVALVESGGLARALSYIATLTGHRHVALLKAEGLQPGDRAAAAVTGISSPTAIVYIDRADGQAAVPTLWPQVVLDACYVRDGRGRLVEARQLRARADAQGAEHGEGPDIGRCSSVPVMDAEGRLYASLCFFDERRRGVKRVDLPLLLEVASLLAQRADRLLQAQPASPSSANAAPQSVAGEEDPGSALDEGDGEPPPRPPAQPPNDRPDRPDRPPSR